MSKERFCLRCFLKDSGMEETLLSIFERMKRIPPNEKTPDGEYNSRLAVCKECDWLVGGTCNKCGCYPEFRAAFIKQHCPAKKW